MSWKGPVHGERPSPTPNIIAFTSMPVNEVSRLLKPFKTPTSHATMDAQAPVKKKSAQEDFIFARSDYRLGEATRQYGAARRPTHIPPVFFPFQIWTWFGGLAWAFDI